MITCDKGPEKGAAGHISNIEFELTRDLNGLGFRLLLLVQFRDSHGYHSIFSMLAFTSSILAFSGKRNLRRKLPWLLSSRCHCSFFSSFSLLLCPLIWRILPSSTSTLTSSFFTPGRSALKTWVSGVSFQSILAITNAEVSRAVAGQLATELKIHQVDPMPRLRRGQRRLFFCHQRRLESETWLTQNLITGRIS